MKILGDKEEGKVFPVYNSLHNKSYVFKPFRIDSS